MNITGTIIDIPGIMNLVICFTHILKIWGLDCQYVFLMFESYASFFYFLYYDNYFENCSVAADCDFYPVTCFFCHRKLH